MLRTPALIALAAFAAGCGGNAEPAKQSTVAAEMRTISSVDPRPTVMDAPPVLANDSPTPKASQTERNAGAEVVELTPEDEKLRSALPFAPAIAMDPVDGSKISIRATTPTFEYKGRVYYFSSPGNRAAFVGNPESFTKGRFSHL
jgi:YHS domain-containing protein